MFKILRAMVAVAALLVLVTGVRADAPTAERMQEIARAWFETHNGNDADAIRTFIETNRTAAALEKRPVDQRVQRRMGMREQIGPLTEVEFVEATANVVVFNAVAANVGMKVKCTFTFEKVEPYKLDSIQIMPAGAAKEVGEWKTTEELLRKTIEENDIPAMAVAVVKGDEVVEALAVGVRADGGTDSVTVDDLWHIGSITKSITATMIGRLIELGKLDRDVTIGEALSDMDMRDEYRDVTLTNLLHHTGGIQPYLTMNADDEARLAKLTGTPSEIRAGFAAEVLGREPINPVGQHNYSNAGYTLVAVIAERATGESWEDLVRKHVFEAAGLKSATFGWPATPEHPNQPRGHFEENGALRVQELDEYDLGHYMSPAGDVSMSIGDLARYARMHLRGLKGQDGPLEAKTIQWLHTPPDPNATLLYAAGWIIADNPGIGETHWHNGSAGTFYASAAIFPEKNQVVVVATNGGVQRGQGPAEKIIELLIKREE